MREGRREQQNWREVPPSARPTSVLGADPKKRCREAGLEEVSTHGLRKLGAQRCTEAGATEHQLMALFGWTNPQQAAVYPKKANRAKLEAQAAALLQAQISNKGVPLLRWRRPLGQTGRKALIINAAFWWWRPPTGFEPVLPP